MPTEQFQIGTSAFPECVLYEDNPVESKTRTKYRFQFRQIVVPNVQ